MNNQESGLNETDVEDVHLTVQEVSRLLHDAMTMLTSVSLVLGASRKLTQPGPAAGLQCGHPAMPPGNG